MNITSRLEQTAESHPDKPALIYLSTLAGKWETVTYRQLENSIQSFVLGLQVCGVSQGMTAALLTPPSVDFFALAIALLKVGIVPIILDPAIGLKKIAECLAEANPDIFIGNGLTHTLRFILGWGRDSIKHNLTIRGVKNHSRHPVQIKKPEADPFTASSPAAIIYTSGSTGIPKGVLFTHGNFAAQLDMLVDAFNISPDEIDLPAFPLYALIDVLLGVTSIIPDIAFPVPGRTDPKKVIGAIQKFNVTNMFASPVVLDILASFALRRRELPSKGMLAGKMKSLKRVITAGAPATIQLQEDFRKLLDDETDLFGIYGATEVLPIAKVESREIFEIQDRSSRGAGVCLGKPVNGMKVKVIQISELAIEQWQDSLEAATNVVGEITVQGGAVTESYIAREEANLLAKIHDGDQIIHRMGDVGYFDGQGRLWYCGRKSHRVITHDDVLFTEQVEGVFNIHPLVYRTALVGMNGEPALWVELRKGVKENKDKIRSELMNMVKEFPQASRIRKFFFMNKFPTDVRHNSKIIREKLAMLAKKRLT